MTMLRPSLFLAALLAAGLAQAAGIDQLVGRTPGRLLKQEPAFAKAYRSAVDGHDLPDWTKRLTVGFPAEAVSVGGKPLLLVSACNPKGCSEERIYLLFDAAEKSLTGFFFLPPTPDSADDHRMALSRWLGKAPSRERNEFLLERAMTDSQPAASLPNQ